MKMKRKFSRGAQKFLRTLPKSLKSHHNYSSLSVCIQSVQKSCYWNTTLTSAYTISSKFRPRGGHLTELLGPWDHIWMYMITITVVRTMKNSKLWKCRQTDRLYVAYSIYIKRLLHFMALQWLWSNPTELFSSISGAEWFVKMVCVGNDGSLKWWKSRDAVCSKPGWTAARTLS